MSGTGHVEAIVRFITENGPGISLVEIENELLRLGVDIEGEMAVGPDECPNLFIWAGMSQDFADVLKAVMQDRRVKATQTSPLVYLCDGKALTFPLARKPPRQGYREPHWVPVCFGPNS